MPELPEMEHYRSMLNRYILNKPIRHVEVTREKTINCPVTTFQQALLNQTITTVQRRGKHLLFHLNNNQVLLLHLMLSGFMYWGTDSDKLDRTAQVTLTFDQNKLFFHGLRLGYLHIYTNEGDISQQLAPIGPEPLMPLFTANALAKLLQKKRTVLKKALTDQHVIAGIGNCYSDEICFQARQLPLKNCQELSTADIQALFQAFHEVLTRALQLGGYMEQRFYKDDRLTGGYNHHCLVYDRPQEPCLRCQTPIVMTRLASRKVFYCPTCQL
ncbi:bifunctional DNA-formamidopyrimidine glycosylase/DNA-(apurinic or apyrimidinic site) lyase [Brevibacillus laterosporus]|uniref:bifunctional DNA-formamidopyrimidine glycosylase/DNA-(apurinic or apyrimidinic site) lyase n=1 Tax=Brevibacillus laterosporus TaxID=1465 RepID=UPI002E1B4248|nr:bifunctional DNA-formamidopyrimidine glycosylase/DNA-(apurinic or apyrimidinic site) lyase [Brevibacillus laterosporus]MED1789704.1 bifunctional DNA-formamidopyrimidine glycosylase/DNA-(apurinic or apyrimidinic site) lyase [Brevibacillus laterosporus]